MRDFAGRHRLIVMTCAAFWLAVTLPEATSSGRLRCDWLIPVGTKYDTIRCAYLVPALTADLETGFPSKKDRMFGDM